MTKDELKHKLTGASYNQTESEDFIMDQALKIINELEARIHTLEDEAITRTNDDDSGLSQAEISCKEFFDINKAHTLCETNPNWRKIQEEQSYNVGRKLWLEIEIVDKAMSNYLLRWMYGRDKNHNIYIPFGAKLNTISFVIPGAEQMKKQLIDFINTL